MADSARKREIERCESELRKLQTKRDRMTAAIDKDIALYEKLLNAARSRAGSNGAGSRTVQNTFAIKGSSNESALFLYKLLGEYEQITFGEIKEFAKEAHKKGELSKYSEGSLSGALSAYTCFVSVERGTWKLGRSR